MKSSWNILLGIVWFFHGYFCTYSNQFIISKDTVLWMFPQKNSNSYNNYRCKLNLFQFFLIHPITTNMKKLWSDVITCFSECRSVLDQIRMKDYHSSEMKLKKVANCPNLSDIECVSNTSLSSNNLLFEVLPTERIWKKNINPTRRNFCFWILRYYLEEHHHVNKSFYLVRQRNIFQNLQ